MFDRARVPLMLFLSFLAFSPPVSAAAGGLEGPEELESGRIGTFESELPGSVLIFPAGKGDLISDSGKLRFYFASTIPGEYTLVFFGVSDDGQPVLLQKAFQVKGSRKAEPQPDPEPSPDMLSAKEKENLNWCVSKILEGIQNRTITSTYNVRVMFKSYVESLFPEPTDAVRKTLDRWTSEADWTSLEALRKSFLKFQKETAPASVSTCPDGQCPKR